MSRVEVRKIPEANDRNLPVFEEVDRIAALTGFASKEIEVTATPREIMIKAAQKHQQSGGGPRRKPRSRSRAARPSCQCPPERVGAITQPTPGI